MWNGKAAERGKTIATLARICPTKKLADADGTRPLITCHPLSHASLFLETMTKMIANVPRRSVHPKKRNTARRFLIP